MALCLVGSALVLLAVRRPWLSYPSPGDLTIRDLTTEVRGTAVAGAVQALSLVGIAGVVAIAATKGIGRVVVGAIVALAGALVVVDLAHLLGNGLGHRLVGDASPTWAWPVLTLVGGLLMTAGGVLVAWRGRRWAALSSSYEVPVAREAQPPVTDKGAWDALDRGDDPTA